MTKLLIFGYFGVILGDFKLTSIDRERESSNFSSKWLISQLSMDFDLSLNLSRKPRDKSKVLNLIHLFYKLSIYHLVQNPVVQINIDCATHCLKSLF